MGTRFEETLGKLQQLSDLGATRDEKLKLLIKNGYTEDRFRSAFERFSGTGQMPAEVPYSPGVESVKNIANSALYGVPRKAEALVRSGPYEENITALKENEAIYKQQYPKSALVGDIAGGVASGAAMLKIPGVARAIGAAPGQSLLNQSARSGATAFTDDLIRDVTSDDPTKNVGESAPYALAAGAVLPGAFRGLGSLYDIGRGALSPTYAKNQAEMLGRLNVSEALEKDNVTLADLRAKLAQYDDQSNVALVDLLNPNANTVNVLRQASKQERGGKIDTTEELTRRINDMNLKLSDDLLKLAGLPVSGRERAHAGFAEKLKTDAKPLYDAAYADKTPITGPEAERFLKDPYVRDVLLPRARAAYAAEEAAAAAEGRAGSWSFPEKVTKVKTEQDPLTAQWKYGEQREPLLTTQLLHTLKKVDTNLNTYEGRRLLAEENREALPYLDTALNRGFKKSILDPVMTKAREMNKPFDIAQKTFGDDAGVKRAFELSQGFESKSADDLRFLQEGMSDIEKKAFQSGVLNDFKIRKLDRKVIDKDQPSEPVKITAEDAEKLRAVIGDPNAAERFIREVKKANIFAQSRRTLMGGTSTANDLKNLLIGETAGVVPPSALGGVPFGKFMPLAQQIAGRVGRGALRAPSEAVSESTMQLGVMNQGRAGLESTFATLRKVQEMERLRNLQLARGSALARAGLLGAE